MDVGKLKTEYRDALLHNVIPFWEKHSPDRQYGGYFTCLERDGKIFDTDKFVWLQGRQVWLFSTLYNRVEKKAEWLDMARLGAGFLARHGHDGHFNWYFSLTREGQPLVEPYNVFSDCFATMAFGQLYKATGDDAHAHIAKSTFQNILNRVDNPKGRFSKVTPGTRPLKGFSLPMILCNLALEIEHLLPAEVVEETIQAALHEVMEVFYQEESGLILENVKPDGSFSDTFDGRLLNPGHGIEAMWFVMDLAVRLGKPELIEKATEIVLRTLDYAWDKEHGGIFYFMDIKGAPPQQLEWDQKLWWVHMETLISLIKSYQLTGNEKCVDWFERVHAYTWAHFSDAENGEWFGYLNRRGEVLLPLKGGKWKGCFHVPRGLLQVWKTLELIDLSQR
ncbi:AGE family epimerase/isomerase [Geofilum rubicundum]|uniref:N-acylglucosamine 2-epimerase n=1 Tax=Geofilum rubicundum JCM 15548 TaxID=1236989 RepID=A0A0E9LVX7_9BACT|nr:AGE family epimerase/isomerase [Geofilum rubicundum]GAO29015.1 N-acylglucosamine 2-epimerase [Geofilum rubicundum JCM 15548]